MPRDVEFYIIDYESDQFPSKLVGKYFVKIKFYEDIEGSVSPVYDEVSVRGRSEEHVFYSHTGGDNYNFNLRLAASAEQNDGSNAEEIYRDFLFIKSFNYPDYGINNQGPLLPPRKAIITIGRWFKKVGIIKDVNETFSKTCDENGYPLIIDVRFQFRVINLRPMSMRDIRAEKTYSEQGS
jgi:hypothetical protein